MSSPIPFSPTPYTVDADPADAHAAFTTMGGITNGNFEKINQFIRPNVPVFGRSIQVSQPAAFTLNAWTDFAPANWPPFTITLPPRPSCLIVGISGHLEWVAGTNAWWVSSSLRFSGAGLVTTLDPHSKLLLRASYAAVAGGRIVVFPATQLKGGQQVTITPQYQHTAPAGTSQQYLHCDSHSAWAIALV